MAAPSPVPGVVGAGPTVSPALIPLAVTSGGSGGGVFGVVVSEIQGFCIAFGSTPSTDTPLWVRLDDPAGPFVVSGFTIDRGRSYELDRTDVGTASVTIIDQSGAFDPTNPTSPFVNNLNPMKPAALAIRNPVTGAWSTVFRGFVARYSYDMYPTENYMTVTVDLVDGMGYLAGIELIPDDVPTFGHEWTSLVNGQIVYHAIETGNGAGQRITKALNEADWPNGLREIFSGNVSIKRTVYAPRSPLLSVIHDAADAEFPAVANFYFAKDGKATFHGRFARFNPTTAEYHISTWKAGDVASVAGDSTRALIFDLEFDKDHEKIINSALITPQGMVDDDYALQVQEDASSIATYGRKSISFENLLTEHDFASGEDATVATQYFAYHYVQNYANPKTRVNTVTFKGSIGPDSTYSERVWRIICGVDISDIIDLQTTHDWVGSGTGGFNQQFYVEGVHYEVQPQNDEHLDVTLTLDLSPKSYYDTNVWA